MTWLEFAKDFGFPAVILVAIGCGLWKSGVFLAEILFGEKPPGGVKREGGYVTDLIESLRSTLTKLGESAEQQKDIDKRLADAVDSLRDSLGNVETKIDASNTNSANILLHIAEILGQIAEANKLEVQDLLEQIRRLCDRQH